MMVRLAAVFGFLAVALGAFGAHWLKPMLEERNVATAWQTAVLYHFLHALALLIVGYFAPNQRVVGWCFSLGIFLFSGSLYLMALTNIRALGAVTPLGGLAFLAGWAWLAFGPKP